MPLQNEKLEENLLRLCAYMSRAVAGDVKHDKSPFQSLEMLDLTQKPTHIRRSPTKRNIKLKDWTW